MVIPDLPGGIANLTPPILAHRRRVTTSYRRLLKISWRPAQNILAAKTPFDRPHSSAVHHRGATVTPSSTRGAPMTLASRAAATAIASLFLLSSAFAQTTTPATPAPAAKMAPTEKKAAKPRTAESHRMLKGSRRQGAQGQRAQEIPFRMQEGRDGQAEDVAGWAPPSFEERAGASAGAASATDRRTSSASPKARPGRG